MASNAALSFVPPRERGFPVTAYFPGLHKEYLPLLSQMGRALGTFLESPPSTVSVVAKAAGLPSVRVIILEPARLPTEISLPTLRGDWITHRVEFLGCQTSALPLARWVTLQRLALPAPCILGNIV